MCMKRPRTAVFVSSELLYLLNHVGAIPTDTLTVNNREYLKVYIRESVDSM